MFILISYTYYYMHSHFIQFILSKLHSRRPCYKRLNVPGRADYNTSNKWLNWWFIPISPMLNFLIWFLNYTGYFVAGTMTVSATIYRENSTVGIVPKWSTKLHFVDFVVSKIVDFVVSKNNFWLGKFKLRLNGENFQKSSITSFQK